MLGGLLKYLGGRLKTCLLSTEIPRWKDENMPGGLLNYLGGRMKQCLVGYWVTWVG
jgi:hypothetical protein